MSRARGFGMSVFLTGRLSNPCEPAWRCVIGRCFCSLDQRVWFPFIFCQKPAIIKFYKDMWNSVIYWYNEFKKCKLIHLFQHYWRSDLVIIEHQQSPWISAIWFACRLKSFCLYCLCCTNKIILAALEKIWVDIIKWPMQRMWITISWDMILVRWENIWKMTIQDISWYWPRTPISTKQSSLGDHYTPMHSMRSQEHALY